MVVDVLMERWIPGHDDRHVTCGKGKCNGSGAAMSDHGAGRASHLYKCVVRLDPEATCPSWLLAICSRRDDHLIGQATARDETIEGEDQPIHGLRVGAKRDQYQSNGPSTSARRYSLRCSADWTNMCWVIGWTMRPVRVGVSILSKVSMKTRLAPWIRPT